MLARKRLNRSVGVAALLAFVTLSSSGCWFLWDDDGPAQVTRDFWNAARDGNQEMVEALSVNHLGDFDVANDGGDEIRSISIGDTEIEGDEAEVVTVLEGMTDDRDVTLEFRTALVKEDGEWLVEMGETTGRLVGAVMATVGAELGEAFSEGLDEAMEGMSDEIAEAMEEAAKAMREAAEEMREERSRREGSGRGDN
jgi:hypothetical protein